MAAPVPALSWSHLLTVMGFAGALVAQWVSMSNRQAGVEATVAALQQTVSAIEARAHQADEANRASDASLREAVRIIDSKVTQLLLQDRASAARR